MLAHAQRSFAPNPALLPAEARGFMLRLLLWFPALLLLWLPLGPAYRATFVAAGNAAFALSGSAREVLFLRHDQWAEIGVTPLADVAVLVRRADWSVEAGRKQHVLAKAICTFHQPFAASAFLLVLFLAARMRRRERWAKIAVAFVALHLVMAAAVAIDARHALDALEPAAGSAWARTLVAMLHFSVTDWPAGVFIVPLLIWTFLCWPRPGQSPA